MKALLTLIGILAVLAGLIFMGQGSGYFPYPASSFMVGRHEWIDYGGGIALVGLLLIILGRRR